MMRGFEDADVITPNRQGPALMLLIRIVEVRGVGQVEELATNIECVRFCNAGSFARTPCRDCAGQDREPVPTPLFPKSVSRGPVPFGASGAEVNAAALR